MTGRDRAYRIVHAGDSALIVEFEERIDPAINARSVAVAGAVRAASLPGVRDVVPTFRSVAIYFDPLRTDIDRLSRVIDAGADAAPAQSRTIEPIRVPVCYGGQFGPDLEEVAAFAGVSGEEVVRLHTGRTYRVFMLGFLPGFAYMGSVDRRIAAPRRATPRLRVAAGSVGVAGAQTGIYPSESPGGWQVIGRTPIQPFDLHRPEPFLFLAGDSVRFYSISESEFQAAPKP
jgi:inhibitor of KinA